MMFLVDIMHEFELGVWRALFIHLLRILDSVSPTLLNELDHRYVLPIYSFGNKLTIMKIQGNPCIWKLYDPAIFEQQFGTQKDGRSRLRGPPAGE